MRRHKPIFPADFLYHVTLTDNVPGIKEKGVLPLRKSNWKVRGSGKRYGGGEIYAMENLSDAIRWSANMEWQMFQKTGTGSISIVKIKRTGSWEVDDNDPMSQASNTGKWLKSTLPVAPEDAVSSVPVTTEMYRAQVKGVVDKHRFI